MTKKFEAIEEHVERLLHLTGVVSVLFLDIRDFGCEAGLVHAELACTSPANQVDFSRTYPFLM